MTKFKQMEQKAQKLETKNKMLAEQIAKQEEQLKQKRTSEELKQIDLNQLLIQNKKLVKEIDMKNKQVDEFKKKATSNLIALNNLRSDLEKITKENDKIKEELVILRNTKPLQENALKVINEEMHKLESDQEKVQRDKENFSKTTKPTSVESLIKIKNKEDNLKREINNYMRKIMIASMNAKKERKKLKERGLRIDLELEAILKMNQDLISL